MRTPTIRAYALGIITGAALTAGTALLATPTANADTDVDRVTAAYADTFGPAVCATLDEYPTLGGILGVAQAIVEDGLSAYQAGQVLYLAADRDCPHHLPMLLEWAATANTAVA